MRRMCLATYKSSVFVLLAGVASFAPAALAKETPPLILAQKIPDVELKGARDQKSVSLRQVLSTQPSALVILERETCLRSNCPLAQLKLVESSLLRSGYQLVYVISGSSRHSIDLPVHPLESILVFNDEAQVLAREIGVVMPDGKLIPTVLLLGADLRVRYEYVAISPAVPLSGEVLLTAARVYKDAVVRPSADE